MLTVHGVTTADHVDQLCPAPNGVTCQDNWKLLLGYEHESGTRSCGLPGIVTAEAPPSTRGRYSYTSVVWLCFRAKIFYEPQESKGENKASVVIDGLTGKDRFLSFDWVYAPELNQVLQLNSNIPNLNDIVGYSLKPLAIQ